MCHASNKSEIPQMTEGIDLSNEKKIRMLEEKKIKNIWA